MFAPSVLVEEKAMVEALVVTKAKAKAKHSQRQEFATTVIGMDTWKHSVGRSRWTWDTKLGP